MFNCEYAQTCIHVCLMQQLYSCMKPAQCSDVDNTYQTSVAMGGQREEYYVCRYVQGIETLYLQLFYHKVIQTHSHETLILTNKTYCSLVSSVCFEWSEIFHVICNLKVDMHT